MDLRPETPLPGALSAPILVIGGMPEAVTRRLDGWGYHAIRGALDADVATFADTVRVIAVGGGQALPMDWLARFPNLELVAVHGVGTDGIDLTALRERGVAVTTTPDVLTDDVAELAIALLLGVLRRVAQNDRAVRDGGWRVPFGRRLAGCSVGIAGMGRIGRAIAQRLEGFNVTLEYTSRHRRDDLPYAWHADVGALAAAVDALILIVPGGDATRHMVGAEALAALGPNGVLVNVARGSVVDEDALLAALEGGTIAGAALDVFAQEPAGAARFAHLPNVLLQPHQGSATVEARTAMADLVVGNIAGWLTDRRLLTPLA